MTPETWNHELLLRYCPRHHERSLWAEYSAPLGRVSTNPYPGIPSMARDEAVTRGLFDKQALIPTSHKFSELGPMADLKSDTICGSAKIVKKQA